MRAKLFLRVEWNETFRTRRDPFAPNFGPEILVEWIGFGNFFIEEQRETGKEHNLIRATLVTKIGPISKWRYNVSFVKMAITQDGLSQLLSSYASDESEGSGSEKEDSAGKHTQTIKSMRGKGNPHKADDAGYKGCSIQRLANVILVQDSMFFCIL